MINITRYLNDFEEYIILQVIISYLCEGKSHRQIQRDVLHLPAPTRGGGFIAMDILHHFNIRGDKKGLLIHNDISEEIKNSTGSLHEILQKVIAFKTAERQAKNNIKAKIFTVNNNNTEITAITKNRINQNVLRDFVLNNYNNQCAICKINKPDLLVCSHIKPWKEDIENRLNPSNAICFCVLHDKLFDRGYFSLDRNYNIIFSSKADSQIKDIVGEQNFKAPVNYKPDILLLDYHHKEICK